VFNCGTGSAIAGMTTKEEIDAFIKNRYDTMLIRPSYVLLMGDVQLIPCFYHNDIGTDWDYAILGAVATDLTPDLTPDFAVGRIPVDTLDQANVVVNKIIDYEKTPPLAAAVYSHAAIAAQFQCCRTDVATAGTDQRTFIQVAEFARNVMLGKGKTVDRIYTRTGPATTPARYYDGSLLPAAIGSGSGFAWSGSTADISTAWNAGRFLIIHRDHGWQEGWVNPMFENPNVDALTNGSLLPVLFSVNCASGFFDNETAGGAYGTSTSPDAVYFAERALAKSDGGAVGVLGDSRNSPSWANSVQLQGFIDAIWPSAIPSFGDSTSKRRLGDILNHGKLYLLSKVGLSVMGQVIGSSDATNELYLWHCLGDPTLEIWTGYPYTFILSPILVSRYLTSMLTVNFDTEGATITAFQFPEEPEGEMLIIGRGVVENGVAMLPYINEPNRKLPLQISASLENAISKQFIIEPPLQ